MGNAAVLGSSEPCWTCAHYQGTRCDPQLRHWCGDRHSEIRDPDAGCGRWKALERTRVPGKRIIVCGGRDYFDRERVHAALDAAHAKSPIGILVHGGAAGADITAAYWAKDLEILRAEFPALWNQHGHAAGPIRNQAMVDAGAHGAIAFPGGRGTADCVRRCIDAGIPVWKPYG